MPKTRLISPGSIPNHKLLKNLQLQGNYISNDGDDEGITVDNDGNVGIGQASPTALLEVEQGASGGTAAFKVDNNDTDEIAIEVEAANIDADVLDITANAVTTANVIDISATGLTDGKLIEASSYSTVTDGGTSNVVHFTMLNDGTGDQTAKGILLAYSKAAITADSKTANITGMHIDLLDALINVGEVNATGLDIDVDFANTGGTVTSTGLNVAVSGADTNYAAILMGGNVGIGVAAPASPLEIFSTSSQLKLSYDESNYADITVGSDGAFEIATTGSGSSHLTLDAAGNIEFEPGRYFYVRKSAVDTTGELSYDMSEPEFRIKSKNNASDWFKIDVGDEGATTISTVDQSSAVGHLTLAPDGHVEFDGCAVGFDKETAAFSTSPIDSDANDSTDVDFRLGNKFELTLTDDIAGMVSGEYINMIFPATSGNFILVLIQGVADCTVANTGWIAYQSDGSTKAANDVGNDQPAGRVRWAGGSAPTLSTAQYDVDIISIYWDAENETAFAVASLDF